MTTSSILSPCAGNLTGHEVQALRDFALEAPYEWRKLFEELADLVEAADGWDADDLKGMHEDTDEVVKQLEQYKDALEEVRQALVELKKATDEKDANVRSVILAVVDFEKTFEYLMADLKAETGGEKA